MPAVAKSTKTKAACGTLRPCREKTPALPVCEKKLSAVPPKGLRADAKEAWSLAVECAPAGALSALDLSVLERWARNYDMYRKLARLVEDEGVVCMDDPSKVNPKFNALIKVQQVLASCEKELGFTPVSRARVHAPEDTGQENEFADF